MKNYEQMTEDVLHRAEQYRIQQKYKRRMAMGFGVIGCLILLIAVNILTYGNGISDGLPSLEQPTGQYGSQPSNEDKIVESQRPDSGPQTSEPEDKVPHDYGVVLLLAASPDDSGTELEENITLPMYYHLRVRDLRGLNDGERDIAINEERNLNDQFWNTGLGSANWKRINGLVRGDYMISFARINQFRLMIQNFDEVESISIRCTTSYGELDVEYSDKIATNWWEVELLPEDVSDFYRETGLRISWDYTNALLEELDKDPCMPLSSFSDIVAFTVKFLDGTVKETKVHIKIQDDGQFVATMLKTLTK